MTSVLPDRERRHLLQFYVLPKIGYRTRLFWAGGLAATALLLQVIWPAPPIAAMLAVTIPLLCVATSLLLVQGFDLEPSYSVTRGEWEKTTRDRFQEIRKLQDAVSAWDQVATDITCGSGAATMLLVAAIVAGVTAILAASPSTAIWAPVFAADAAVLILPHWICGTRRGWRPVALREQIDALEVALHAIEPYEEPPCQIQPMFQVAGKGDARTPIGARVFVRFPDGPEDFLGLQYQVAINAVKGSNYPYLYAVLVARQSFGLCDKDFASFASDPAAPEPSGFLAFLGIAGNKKRLVVEKKSEDDVDVVVVRQYTTKESGYHTDRSAIANLARVTWEMASSVAEPVAA